VFFKEPYKLCVVVHYKKYSNACVFIIQYFKSRLYCLSLIYTWRTLTGIKLNILNNNRTQHLLYSSIFFGSVTKAD